MQPVLSSSLASLAYVAETQTLEIQFRHGGVYRFSEVPEFEYQQLLLAESKGRAFNLRIKGRFSFVRVGGR